MPRRPRADAREPQAQIAHAGKEACFRNAEQKAQRIKAVGADDEGRCQRDDAPRHITRAIQHARRPVTGSGSMAPAQEVADEEEAAAETQLGRRKPDGLVHPQRGKANVHAIKKADEVKQNHERKNAQLQLARDAASRSEIIVSSWSERRAHAVASGRDLAARNVRETAS